jgi:membrane protease subunit (stomatin/prohibitin family)
MDDTTNLKEIWICPSCGKEMNLSQNGSMSVYICPECGCTIEAGTQNYDINNLCPNCNQVIDENECSYCGYDLGSDFD